MFFVEGDPQITDVVLMPNPYADAGSKPGRPLVYFDGSLRITEDIWLADFDSEFATAILDACGQIGENFKPIRQYGAPYGFVRVSAPYTQQEGLQFDHDGRLLSCVALSRLVHPTSLGFQYSARIRQWKNGHRQIVPHTPHDVNAYAFVTDIDRNWLIPDDAPVLSQLFTAYFSSKPPQRVLAALWNHETVARNHYIDVRWPLLVTGLEALVHLAGERDLRNPVKYAGSTRVFVQRLVAIGKHQPALAVPEDVLRDIYDRRSTLAHGQSFGALDPATKILYRATEDLLRGILRIAILNSTFASTFASDAAVQSNYPLS